VHGDVFAKRAVERFDKVRRGHGLLAFRRWGKKVGLEECRARASTTGAAVAVEVDRGRRPGACVLGAGHGAYSSSLALTQS
jgi:hypothetical protein